MNNRLKRAFLMLIVLQAAHSIEEYVFKFYEVFAPARLINNLLPGFSRPGFIAFNVLLVCLGLFCYIYWIRPAKPRARVAIWFWIVIESYNAIAHTVWMIVGAGYNPGLISALLFFPLTGYLAYGMRHTMIVVGNRP